MMLDVLRLEHTERCGKPMKAHGENQSENDIYIYMYVYIFMIWVFHSELLVYRRVTTEILFILRIVH